MGDAPGPGFLPGAEGVIRRNQAPNWAWRFAFWILSSRS